MREAPQAAQEHCLKQVDELSVIFGMQGQLTEIDLDNFEIPETNEQAAKRAAGKAVKSDLLAPWRSRFTWDNHEHTTSVRQARSDADKAGKAAEAKRKEKKREQDKVEEYKRGRATPKRRLSKNLIDKYEYLTDYQCHHCKGYWSTWVRLDLRSPKQMWKTPDNEVWYCGLKECLASCMVEDRKVRECKRKEKEEKKARASRKAKETPKSKTKAVKKAQEPKPKAVKKAGVRGSNAKPKSAPRKQATKRKRQTIKSRKG